MKQSPSSRRGEREPQNENEKMISIGTNSFTKTEFLDGDTVCHCFAYTKKDIERDFLKHGYSTILERIKAEKKRRGCDCEVKNPRGR